MSIIYYAYYKLQLLKLTLFMLLLSSDVIPLVIGLQNPKLVEHTRTFKLQCSFNIVHLFT